MRAYFQLMRPANLLTAAADVLAGAALAFAVTPTAAVRPDLLPCITPSTFPANLWLLLVSTVCLYGGGVVLNDVFDADLDATERPERPIPSGRISLAQASWLGTLLLAVGVVAGFTFWALSGWLALLIAGLAVFYDRFGKHHSWFGPLNMGLCRGVNLVLGISAAGASTLGTLSVQMLWPMGLVPVVYIAAVTMVSRGEVHGSGRAVLWAAMGMFLTVSGWQLYNATLLGTLPLAAGFIVLHLFLVLRPLVVAIQNPIGPNIGKAVKAGVLSLIVMDAAWAALSGHWGLALGILALLPLSIPVARYFAVT
jgi:heme O synthase-like polyprenyltransferase